MYKLLFTLFSLLLMEEIYAQPSADQVKMDVKRTLGGNTSVEVVGAGTNTIEYEGGVKMSYHRRRVKATSASIDPAYPNVKVLYEGLAVYQGSGSGYRYKRFNPGTTELLGMPKPSTKELNELLQAKLTEVIRNGESIIGMPKGLEIKENTAFIWHDLNSMSFFAEAQFTQRTNNTTLKELKQPYEIRLYRDNPKAKWTRIFAKRLEDAEVLKTTTHTGAEIDGMKTMSFLFAEQQSAALLARLPKVERPRISSIHDMYSFVETLLMEGDPDLAEAKMRVVMSSGYFDGSGTAVLSDEGQKMVNNVRKAIDMDKGYTYQYCGLPDEKEKGADYLVWYNKDHSNFSRLRIQQEADGWRIAELDIRLIEDAAKQKELAAMPCTTTKLGPVRRGERAGAGNLKAGDKVLGHYEQDGFWYVASLQGAANSYYSVHFLYDNTKGQIRKVVPFTLEVGDKAFYNMDGKGTNPVLVTAINGDKVTIKKNDGSVIDTEARLLIFKP